jgi:hypothetical protein
VGPEGLCKLKKFIHLIGPRTRDLPASSIVSQPLRYRDSLETVVILIRILEVLCQRFLVGSLLEVAQPNLSDILCKFPS